MSHLWIFLLHYGMTSEKCFCIMELFREIGHLHECVIHNWCVGFVHALRKNMTNKLEPSRFKLKYQCKKI